MIKTLSLVEVEYLAHRLARELMNWDEPIPNFSTRFPHVLESCLAVPFQRYARRSLYPSLLDKAGILFYLMVKNHPFQNGNKRVAVTTALVFLYKNHRWLKADNQELYNLAKWVASSHPRLKDPTVAAIRQFLQYYLVPIRRKSRG